ncbi:MAG: hypothetical protein V7739_07995 [Motiliproteus sp.]
MTRTLNIHAGIMLVLSVIVTYVTLGMTTANVDDTYSIGVIGGLAVASTLFPLLLISIPAGIYKYFKKRSLPGFYIWLWLYWIIFTLIASLGNMLQA